jgi:glycosyltransferase involved in cell wall biosynthesis
MPNSVIEALAFGKPVIATKVGGIPEIVEDGYNGILVPPQSPQHLAEALCLLISDEELFLKLSYNAAHSGSMYSWSEVVLRYKEIYSEVLHSFSVKNKK